MVSSLIELDKCCKKFYTKLYATEVDKEGFGEVRKTFLRV
jgi:hypothetical protein